MTVRLQSLQTRRSPQVLMTLRIIYLVESVAHVNARFRSVVNCITAGSAGPQEFAVTKLLRLLHAVAWVHGTGQKAPEAMDRFSDILQGRSKPQHPEDGHFEQMLSASVERALKYVPTA